MTTVFVGGSRRIARLPVEAKTRIDSVVDKGFAILVGDANLAVLLGRMQRCESSEALLEVAKPLRKCVQSEGHAGLAGAFAAWNPQVRIPELRVTGAVKSDNGRGAGHAGNRARDVG